MAAQRLHGSPFRRYFPHYNVSGIKMLRTSNIRYNSIRKILIEPIKSLSNGQIYEYMYICYMICNMYVRVVFYKYEYIVSNPIVGDFARDETAGSFESDLLDLMTHLMKNCHFGWFSMPRVVFSWQRAMVSQMNWKKQVSRCIYSQTLSSLFNIFTLTHGFRCLALVAIKKKSDCNICKFCPYCICWCNYGWCEDCWPKLTFITYTQ